MYPFRSTWVRPGFYCGSRYSIFSFMCMFCRSLFVLLYFFCWQLCCLFFDLRILITLLYLQTLLMINFPFVSLTINGISFALFYNNDYQYKHILRQYTILSLTDILHSQQPLPLGLDQTSQMYDISSQLSVLLLCNL